MHRHVMSALVRRALAVSAALAAGAAGLVAIAGPASAHAAPMTATASCAPDGTYTVVYTGVSNVATNAQFALDAAHTVPAASAVTPSSVAVLGQAPFVLTQTGISGTATLAHVDGTITWTDHVALSVGASVALAGTCAATAPPTTTAVPLAPIFTDGSCATPQGGYVIPAVTGVIYSIAGQVVLPGSYLADVGILTITAAPAAGYTLLGATTWNHDYLTVTGCAAPVTAGVPTSVQPTCSLATGSYQIPVSTGISYAVDGSTVAAGTYVGIGAGTSVTVTATARPGFILIGPDRWTSTFLAPKGCGIAVDAVTPRFVDATCATGGGFLSIPDVTGIDYSVDAEVLAPGDYLIGEGETFDIVATAWPGYRLVGLHQWTFVVSVPTGCDPGGSDAPPITSVDAPPQPGGTPTTPNTVVPLVPLVPLVPVVPVILTGTGTGTSISAPALANTGVAAPVRRTAGVGAAVILLGAGLCLAASRRRSDCTR